MPLSWYVTWRLWRLNRQAPDALVLRERTIAALALSIIVTVFALVFVNNDLMPPFFDIEATRLITRSTILALSVLPSVYFLWLYRKS
jgi:Na+/proline symporter